MMTRDFADFLAALNSEGVSYVVIGGMAVLALIPYRTTRDIDVLIEPTLANAERARRAVGKWGHFEPEYAAQEFLSGDILSFGGLLRVDLHSEVPGVDWAGVSERAEAGEFQGVPTRFACLEDLIAMKAAAGRPEKDLPDLRRLRKLLERRRRS
jgi:predicted nucleotidyltransferase